MTGRDVYALDLPGHGDSPGPAPAVVGGHVDRVLDWVRTSGLTDVILVGHSLGAAIALSASLRDHEMIRGLVLFGSTAQMEVNPDLLAMTADPSHLHQAHERIVSLSFSRQALAGMVKATRERVAPSSLAALHNDFLACDRFDLSSRLHGIQLPALAVCGEVDRMTPVAACRALASGLPNARFKVVLQAGHMVMQERPEVVGALVRKFLAWMDRFLGL